MDVHECSPPRIVVSSCVGNNADTFVRSVTLNVHTIQNTSRGKWTQTFAARVWKSLTTVCEFYMLLRQYVSTTDVVSTLVWLKSTTSSSLRLPMFNTITSFSPRFLSFHSVRLDPYVKVWLQFGDKRIEKRKTPIFKCTLNPVFNEAFSFNVPWEKIRECSLDVMVMDFDNIGRNELIGRIQLAGKISVMCST